METIYLVCTILGATLLVGQFVLSLFGFGGDHDAGGDHGPSFDVGHDVDHHGDAHHAGHDGHSTWFFKALTYRALVAALTFFGLGGLAGASRNLEEPMPVLFAVAAGLCAMFLVAWVMQLLHKLQAEGTIRIDRAVGAGGTVYLTVPARKSGTGKVLINVQNRTMEYQAVTAQTQELPTGAKVVVVGVVAPGTVEVGPAA
jgi:hypothetical protein